MTRSLAEPTETQRRRRNNSVGGSADPGLPTAVNCVDGIGAPAAAQSDAATALTGRLNRLTQEVSQSRQRSEQLQAALEKRTRRVQQLIGDRDRLTSLLVARDAELQRVNRELGALCARVEPAQVRAPGLFTAARKLLDGLQNARKDSRRAKPAALQAHQPDVRVKETRLVPWLKDRPPKDVFVVVVFGLSESEIERVLDAVERYCAKHEAAPLLLTDNNSFQLFRNRRVVFEFLPAFRAAAARVRTGLADLHPAAARADQAQVAAVPGGRVRAQGDGGGAALAQLTIRADAHPGDPEG